MCSKILAPLVLAFGLAGCASTPDLTVNYFLPKTAISIHVVRTVACNTQKDLFTASTVTSSVTHSADLTKRKTVDLKTLDGALSDTDVQFQFYEDGRLKGVNATTTGEAEATIKPLVSLASAAFGPKFESHTQTSRDACSFSTDPSKPVTLTFTHDLDPDPAAGDSLNQLILPDPDSKELFDSSLHIALGYPCIHVEKSLIPVDVNGLRPSYIPAKENAQNPRQSVELWLQQPALVALRVWNSKLQSCSDYSTSTQVIWAGQAEVAQLGTPYSLPMPRSVLFGKLAFGVAVAESGSATSVQYTKLSGAPSASVTANDVNSGFVPQTTAQKAAELKAESDIIVEQQRLVRCRANPNHCT